ncbi:MAG: hypothetical protein RJQ08_14735 [Salinisphaeraceae bacterium]
MHRIMASGSPVAHGVRNQSQREGLLLCGLLVGFAQHLLADLDDIPRAMLVAHRWASSTLPRDTRVQGRSIVLDSSTKHRFAVLPTISQWIDALPAAVVEAALRWAPPVVNPPDRHGRHVVIANHPSGLLARYRYPSESIRVRVLLRSSGLRRDLGEICAAIVAVLEPVRQANEGLIARHAPSLEQGILLTGRSRRWVNDRRRRHLA